MTATPSSPVNEGTPFDRSVNGVHRFSVREMIDSITSRAMHTKGHKDHDSLNNAEKEAYVKIDRIWVVTEERARLEAAANEPCSSSTICTPGDLVGSCVPCWASAQVVEIGETRIS